MHTALSMGNPVNKQIAYIQHEDDDIETQHERMAFRNGPLGINSISLHLRLKRKYFGIVIVTIYIQLQVAERKFLLSNICLFNSILFLLGYLAGKGVEFFLSDQRYCECSGQVLFSCFIQQEEIYRLMSGMPNQLGDAPR